MITGNSLFILPVAACCMWPLRQLKADGFFRICTDDDMALASCFSKFSFWTIAIDSSKGYYPLWAAYFETQLAAIKRFYTRNGLENRETSYRYQRTIFTLLSWNSKVKCYFTAYIRPLKEAVLRRYSIIFLKPRRQWPWKSKTSTHHHLTLVRSRTKNSECSVNPWRSLATYLASYSMFTRGGLSEATNVSNTLILPGQLPNESTGIKLAR